MEKYKRKYSEGRYDLKSFSVKSRNESAREFEDSVNEIKNQILFLMDYLIDLPDKEVERGLKTIQYNLDQAKSLNSGGRPVMDDEWYDENPPPEI